MNLRLVTKYTRGHLEGGGELPAGHAEVLGEEEELPHHGGLAHHPGGPGSDLAGGMVGLTWCLMS